MSLRVEFLAGAESDLQSVFNFYEDQQEGLGAKFMETADAHLGRLAVFPEAAPLSAMWTRPAAK